MRNILLLSFFFISFPLLTWGQTKYELNFANSKGPNETFGRWTESGLATSELTYLNERGITVRLSLKDKQSKLVRTLIKGKYAIGVNGPKLDHSEVVEISILGDYAMATVSRLRFIDLKTDEVIEIAAPGLVFFQQNGGRVGSAYNTTVRHDDDQGVTTILGLHKEGGGNVTYFFGPDARDGFPLTNKQSITIRLPKETQNCAFIGLSFFIES